MHFFSGVEIALISLNDKFEHRWLLCVGKLSKLIKKQAEEGDKKAKQLHAFLSDPEIFVYHPWFIVLNKNKIKECLYFFCLITKPCH